MSPIDSYTQTHFLNVGCYITHTITFKYTLFRDESQTCWILDAWEDASDIIPLIGVAGGEVGNLKFVPDMLAASEAVE